MEAAFTPSTYPQYSDRLADLHLSDSCRGGRSPSSPSGDPLKAFLRSSMSSFAPGADSEPKRDDHTISLGHSKRMRSKGMEPHTTQDAQAEFVLDPITKILSMRFVQITPDEGHDRRHTQKLILGQ